VSQVEQIGIDKDAIAQIFASTTHLKDIPPGLIIKLVKRVLNNTKFEELDKIVPSRLKKRYMKEWVTAYRLQYEDPLKGLRLKCHLKIGRRKCLQIDKSLSTIYNPELDIYERWSYFGIQAPKIASDYKQQKQQLRLNQEKGKQVSADGKAVLFGVDAVLKPAIRSHYGTKKFQQALDLDGKIFVGIGADKCNALSNMPMTTTQVTFPTIAVNAQSPYSQATVAVYEGKDDYDDYKTQCQQTATDFVALVKDGVDNHECCGVVLGDMNFQTSVKGTCNNASGCPCPLCKIPKNKLSETDPTELKKFELRTYLDACLLAHAIPGTCPACQLVITADTVATWDGIYTNKQCEQHAQTHFGQKLGKMPVFNVEFCFYIICILHLMLRCVENLFSKTILRDLGEIKPPSNGKGQVEVLFDFLTSIGVRIKLKFLKDKTADHLGTLQKKSFNGKECWLLLEYFHELLAIVYPISLRADPVFGGVVAGYTECWASFKAVMLLLVAEYKTDDTRAEREAAKLVRANQVQAASEKYVNSMNEHTGNSGSVYHHVMVAHLKDQIILVGDLTKFSNQGAEHIHALMKAALLQATNRQQQFRLNSATNIISVMQDQYVGLTASQKDFSGDKRDTTMHTRLMNAPQREETIASKKLLFEEFVPHDDYLKQIKQLVKTRLTTPSASVATPTLAKKAQQQAVDAANSQKKKKSTNKKPKKK
jgi:hypothetical protein